MPLNAKLVVVGGDVKTTEIKLRLPSTIGRGRGTTIVLPHPLVSRQHCELFESGGQLIVRDLGSLNGTFVNNQRVTEAPLAPGELLTVGTVTFRAVYEAEAVVPSEPVGKVKDAAGDKTVRAAKVSTLAAQPKVSPPPKAPADSEPLEFNFDEPLMPAGEDVRATQRGATPETERLNATIAEKATQAGQPKPAKATAKPTAGKKPAPEKPAEEKPTDATVDFSKFEDEDEEDDKSDSSSDDDLNDFLDSLGTK
jgi:predicted component of type VI protein secretion system